MTSPADLSRRDELKIDGCRIHSEGGPSRHVEATAAAAAAAAHDACARAGVSL